MNFNDLINDDEEIIEFLEWERRPYIGKESITKEKENKKKNQSL